MNTKYSYFDLDEGNERALVYDSKDNLIDIYYLNEIVQVAIEETYTQDENFIADKKDIMEDELE